MAPPPATTRPYAKRSSCNRNFPHPRGGRRLLVAARPASLHPLHVLPLAELPAPDSPMAVGWLVLTVAALAVAYNAILSIVDRYKKKETVKTRITDQPLEVRASSKYVERELYDRDREEMRQELSRNASAVRLRSVMSRTKARTIP